MSALHEAIRLLVELRHKSLFRQLKQKYANLPFYVLHDLFRGADEKFFGQLNRLDWKLQVIDVNPASFYPDTLQRFKERGFGNIIHQDVPKDAERTELQKKLVQQRPQGTNEPIIVVKRVNGYALWEGWHRTMNMLMLGDNGGPPEGWTPVKINAWVGSSRGGPMFTQK